MRDIAFKFNKRKLRFLLSALTLFSLLFFFFDSIRAQVLNSLPWHREAVSCPYKLKSWHAILIWGHGLAKYDAILTEIQEAELDVRFVKNIYVGKDHIKELVEEVYRADIERVGPEHIKSKTEYLLEAEPSICLMIVVDSNPDFQSSSLVNSRVNKVKWKIRGKFNHNEADIPPGAKPDERGVFSHAHVIHASDISEGVESLLQYLAMPSLEQLKLERGSFTMPWFLRDHSTYAVEYVKLASLGVKCAVSVRGCGAGETTQLSKSPHYGYAVGNAEGVYEEYYSKGIKAGNLTDGASPTWFQKLKKTFNPVTYPFCTCGVDDTLRRSMIIVDFEYNIIHGLHTAALLLVENKLKVVQVIRIGASGETVKTCPHSIGGSTPKSNLSNAVRSVRDQLFQLDQQDVKYVILRGDPIQPSSKHPDVDLLVDNYEKACAALTGTICAPRLVGTQAVSTADAYFDLRVVGDGYYPDHWAENMLFHRVRRSSGIFHLSNEDQCYALLYHAVIHKGRIGAGYLPIVRNICLDCALNDDISTWKECLNRWIEPRFPSN